MSDKRARRQGQSSFGRIETGAQSDEGLLFAPTSAVDVWGKAGGVDANQSVAVMDGIYGQPARSASELEQENELLRQNATPEGAIVPAGEKSLRLGKFTLDPNGLIWGEGTTAEEWDALGVKLFQISKASQWWVGDWLNTVVGAWGYTVEAAAERFEVDVETLYDWKAVAEKIDFPLRNGNLSFSHHRVVAYLKNELGKPDSEAITHWLTWAASGQKSTKELRIAIADANRKPAAPSRRAVAERKQLFRSLAVMDSAQISKLTPEQKRQSLQEIVAARRHLDNLERVLRGHR